MASRKTWIGWGLVAAAVGTVIGVIVYEEKKAKASTAPATPAVAMNNAIQANGLRKVDMPLYVAFGESAGLTLDSQTPPELFPGPNTIAALRTALSAQCQTLSTRALAPNGQPFPWLPGGGGGCSGYDGTNAPAASQWDPTGVC